MLLAIAEGAQTVVQVTGESAWERGQVRGIGGVSRVGITF